MISYDEPADKYHARQSFSASMAWDIVAPEGCLRLAWHNSSWLNPDYVPIRNELMENGTIAHLAALEEHLLEERVVIIDANSWRTKVAKELRDEAYAAGKIPILYKREEGSLGPDFQKIMAIRTALKASPLAAPLLFESKGNNEVSYGWEDQGTGVLCKARADRIIEEKDTVKILDLKTAPSASPQYFQRAMAQFGHHLRADFYINGWEKQETEKWADYIFVVIQREPPHLVSVFDLDAQALEWGGKLWRKAISDFDMAHKSGRWADYMRDQMIQTVDLPTWAWHQLADREAAGEL